MSDSDSNQGLLFSGSQGNRLIGGRCADRHGRSFLELAFMEGDRTVLDLSRHETQLPPADGSPCFRQDPNGVLTAATTNDGARTDAVTIRRRDPSGA